MNRIYKVVITALITVSATNPMLAQTITNYAFTATSGSFTELTTGTTVRIGSGSFDDGATIDLPIGFDFWYMGTRYTAFSAGGNGIVMLQQPTVSVTLATAYSNALASNAHCIAPFWDDDDINPDSSQFSYQTTGSVGSRICTIQYLRLEANRSATIPDFSYQVKLYEQSGKIEIYYRRESGAAAYSAASASIGISAPTTGSGKYLSLSNSGSNPTVSSTTESASISTLPATGQIYAFTPAAGPTAPASLAFSNLGKNKMTVSWTDVASNESGYALYYSTDGGSTFVFDTLLAANTTSRTAGLAYPLIAGVTYNWRVYAVGEIRGTPLEGASGTLTGSISGTKAIGPGGDYSTLTAALSDLATNEASGAIVYELNSSYVSTSETFPLTITASMGIYANRSLTIRPASGVTARSISGSNASGSIIDLSGCVNVILDGRPGGSGSSKELTIENTSTSGQTLRLLNDANNNTIQYCVLRGSNTSTSSGTVVFASSINSYGNGNSNNTISNCDIREATSGSTPSNCLYSSNSTFTSNRSCWNKTNTISSNNISNFFNTSGATGITLSSGSTDWTISGNSFFYSTSQAFSGTTATTISAISISNTTSGGCVNTVISNNYIGGSASSAGSSAMTITASASTTAATQTFNGVLISGGSNPPNTVSSNTITNINIQSLINAATGLGAFNGIAISSGAAVISNNTIGSASSTGAITVTSQSNSSSTTSACLANGIYSAASFPAAMSISGNTIAGISGTSNSSTGVGSSIIGVQVTGTAEPLVISSNTIGSSSVANSITASTAVSQYQAVDGIRVTSGSTDIDQLISNNTVANLSNSATGTNTFQVVRGIVTTSGMNRIVSNTVLSLTSASGNASTTIGTTSTTACCAIAGIMQASTSSPTFAISSTVPAKRGQLVSLNTVSGLSNTNSTSATVIVGISFTHLNSTSYLSVNQVEKNFVHSFSMSSSASTPQMYGLALFGGGSATYGIARNNMIRLGIDMNGSAVTTNTQICGILKSSTSSGYCITNNSVYVGGSGVSGAGYSMAFWKASTSAGSKDSIINNILVNRRTNGSGSGIHTCTYLSDGGNYMLSNNVYSFVQGSGWLGVYIPSSTAYALLRQWQVVTSTEANSGVGVPNFIDATSGSSAVNLHISSTGSTPVESMGISHAMVTDDFDGQTRSALTPTDIGADAGNFTLNDIYPPSITYTALPNGSASSSRTLSNVVVTDISGVNTTSGTKPRIYFKKSTDANQYVGNTSTDNGWKWVEASGTTSPFSFVINYSLLQASVAVGDVINYFVTAQDLAATPNVGLNTGLPTTEPTSANLAASVFPVTSSLSYNIVSTISGTFNVGPAESITSITNTGGLFDYINNRLVTGNVQVLITGNMTAETGTVALNQTAEEGTGGYFISIRPASGTADTISGSYAGGLVRLNGADRIIFEGRSSGSTTGRSLTILNTATTGTISAVQLMSLGVNLGCVNDTVRYCNIATGLATNTTAYGIFSGSSTIGTGAADNDNFAITNNFIYRTYFGVRILGVAAGPHDNVSVSNNYLGSIGSGLPVADTIRNAPLTMSYANTATVSGNLIKDCSWTTSGVNAVGFDNMTGVMMSSNKLDNLIGATSSSYDFQAIMVGSNVLNASITKNIINKIQYLSTGDWWAYGISVNTGLTNSGLLIANNFITNIQNDYGSGTFPTYVCTGLRVTSTGGVKIYNNSFLLRGTYFNTTSAAYSFAAMIYSGCTNVELLNNIFVNRMYGYTGSKSYGLFVYGAGELSANDYNLYDVTLGTTQGVIGNFAGTDYTTLAAFKAALGGEAHSLAQPLMVIDSSATTDMHLTQQEPTIVGTSSVSSLVPDDIDGVARTHYLMGADEVNLALSYVTNLSNQTLCPGSAYNVSATVTTPLVYDDNITRTTPSISYQWFRNGSAISGATNNSYSISSVAGSDAATYQLRSYASAIDSVVTSSVLTVNVTTAITTQPTGASICLGGTYSMSVAASGTNLSYQWKRNGSSISGATSSTYTIASAVAADFDSYTVVVSGACGSVTSNSVSVVQLSPTVISSQPVATPSSLCLGASFTLSVNASASNIGYQWRRNGNAITGATASSLTITNAQATDFATYSVVISGDCGILSSQNVIVSQIAPTVITSQPATTTPQVCLGQPFTITVSATGANLSYQWRRGGSSIASATSASYSVAAAAAADFATYDVIVTGTCGAVTSSTQSIVQIPPTVIVTNPTASTTLCQGSAFSVSVSATGANLTYQWQKSSGADWINVIGATNPTFNIASVAVSDAGTYHVVVSGTCGSLTTTNAVLIVTTPISITQQPSFSSSSACTGESTLLSMSTSGTVSSYQWQKFDGAAWQNISGATNATLNFPSLALTDAGSYRMVINGPCSATTISNQATLSVQQNVQVSTNPQSVTVCTGGTISMSVSTIGTVIGYQWEQDRTGSGTWTTISGATNSTFTKTLASTLDSGLYRVKVTGNCSAVPVTSQTATATVQSIFNIIGQPSWPAVPYNVGQTVSLTVTVTGTANFQWQRDQQRNGSWVNVGTNAPTYSYTIATIADSGNYRCVVSGPCGATTQNTNVVSVYTCQPPSITTQPVTPQPVCVGGAMSLSVGINGNGQTVSYQWQLDNARNGTWVVINGATNSTYTKNNIQLSDDGFYRVQIISACSAVPVFSNTVSFVVLSANSVTTQPVSQTVCGGSNVTLSVSVAGASPSYQWYYNGAPINTGQNASAQTANLVLTNVQPGTSGSYNCFITGPCSPNGLFSNTAVLTVNTPVVMLQPQSQTGCVGTSLTFTSQISGSGLTYKWQKNQVDIPGATNTNYTIASPALTDAGSYRVIGTNSCGTTTSNGATLTMTVPATITLQPASQSICRGANLTLSVAINSNATSPSYQWQRNGSNLSLTNYPTANTPNLTVNAIQPSEAGSYTCLVISSCQPLGISSSAATIIVNPSTAITTQPVGSTICEGNAYTFSVGTAGINLSYQWIKDGNVLVGATNSSLVLTNPAASDAGNYYVIVNGTCSPTSLNSSTVALIVNTNPRITAPALNSQQACIGSTVTFSTSATGTGLTYQWRFNGSAIGGNVSATTPTLVLSNVSLASAGNYDCLITGLCAPSGVTTNVANLVINTPIAIQTSPASQVACTRSTVRFSVVNSGTGAAYQWRFNGAAINNNPTAATPNLVLTGVGTADGGVYDVVVSGTCNTVTSAAASLTVQTQLMIVTQPEPQRICAGGTITTSVAVNGTALSYQWQKDGVNISGQTSANLIISGALTTHSGGYRCIINGSTACGTTQQVTNTVDVIVGVAPAITKQPSDVAVSYGSTISVSVEAAGLGRGVNNILQYAWYHGTTLITDDSHYSGAATNVLTIRGVLPTDIGTDYSVWAIGVCGGVVSNQFALFVPTVNITSQPQAASVCSGDGARFNIVAVPAPLGGTLYYQWFRGTTALSDGAGVSGSTTATLSLSGLAAKDSGDYSCQVTVQPGGSRVTSAMAHLLVNTAPVVSTQPADVSTCIGSPMSFTVAATGGALTYQWVKDGASISGATNATLTIASVSAADAGVYTVDVRNSCGVTTSSVARGAIAPPPVVTTQPVSQTVGLNAVFSLSVSAAGTGTLRYQWKQNGASIPGATNSTLTISGTTKSNEGSYTCDVSSDCGTTTSNAATITITSTSVIDAEQLGFALLNPEPNPMADFATIRILIPQTSFVTVEVIDLQGRNVSTLVNGILEAGEHVKVLNAVDNNLSSGTYRIRLITSEGYMTSKPVIIVR